MTSNSNSDSQQPSISIKRCPHCQRYIDIANSENIALTTVNKSRDSVVTIGCKLPLSLKTKFLEVSKKQGYDTPSKALLALIKATIQSHSFNKNCEED